MMLKVNRELISKHDIHNRHKFSINVDYHIAYLEISFRVVEFGPWDSIAEWTTGVFFILVWWYICSLGWLLSTILPLRWRGAKLTLALRWRGAILTLTLRLGLNIGILRWRWGLT